MESSVNSSPTQSKLHTIRGLVDELLVDDIDANEDDKAKQPKQWRSNLQKLIERGANINEILDAYYLRNALKIHFGVGAWGCTLHEDDFHNSRHYRRVVYRNVKVLLIHLSLQGDGRPPPPNTEASHLCHNAACFNPHHLVWESHALNIQRKTCTWWRACLCGRYPPRRTETPKLSN